MTKHQVNPTAQVPLPPAASRYWSLGIGASLGNGHWSLVIPFRALLWTLARGSWSFDSLFIAQSLRGIGVGRAACGQPASHQRHGDKQQRDRDESDHVEGTDAKQ